MWVVPAADVEPYLAHEYAWAGMVQMGWVRRWRQQHASAEPQLEQTTWVSSLPPSRGSPARIAQLLRGHWSIENAVHRVRDVRYDDDRFQGRASGLGLTLVRTIAITLLRQQGHRSIPDGWRQVQAQSTRGLHLLYQSLER